MRVFRGVLVLEQNYEKLVKEAVTMDEKKRKTRQQNAEREKRKAAVKEYSAKMR